MAPEERARVLAWAARLYQTEADEVFYRWPPADEAEIAEAHRIAGEGRRIWDRIDALMGHEPGSDASADFWRAAMAAWEKENTDGPAVDF